MEKKKNQHQVYIGSIFISLLLVLSVAAGIYARENLPQFTIQESGSSKDTSDSGTSGSSGSEPDLKSDGTSTQTSGDATNILDTTQNTTSGESNNTTLGTSDTIQTISPQTVFVEIFSPKEDELLSGGRKFSAYTSVPVNEVVFVLDNPASLIMPDKSFFARDAGSMQKWELEVDTREISDGSYNFFAFAHQDNQKYSSQVINVRVYNVLDSIKFQILRPVEKTISGNIELMAEASALVESGYFEIQGEKSAKYPAFVDGRYLKAVWNTFDFPNGEYAVTITALKSSRSYSSEKFIFEVKNIFEVAPPLPANTETEDISQVPIITLKAPSSSPVQRIEVLRAITTLPVNDLLFVISRETGAKEAGAFFHEGEWRYEWNTLGIPNGKYEIFAKAQVSGKVYASQKVMVAVENVVASPRPEEGEALPQQENIVLPEDDNFSMPEPDSGTKEVLPPPNPLPEKISPPPASVERPSDNSPQAFIPPSDECMARGIRDEELCREYKNLPLDCRREGITHPEPCQRYMFSRYHGRKEFTISDKPIDCIQAKEADCAKIIEKKYFPEECVRVGIKSSEDCKNFIAQLYLPQECAGFDITKQFECNEKIKEKYFKEECERQKFSSSAECFDYMFERYGSKMECIGLDADSCKEVMKRRYLAASSLEVKLYEKREEILSPFIKRSVVLKPQLQKSQEAGADVAAFETLEDAVPIVIQRETAVSILPSEKKVFLSGDEKVTAVSSGVMVFDDDLDGLLNDLEERFGTDPKNPDSDGDGFSDGDEIAHSFNPQGAGELKESPEPMELALINKATLEHPKVSGEVSLEMKIERVENITEPLSQDENKDGEVSSYQRFSGKSLPNTVIALYIYSSMPVVVLTRTDEYGNWVYTLKQSLREGEHEVYVTVNDETGKIVSKSEPHRFFVKEAKAVTAQEFFVEGLTAKSSVWESVRVYLLMAGAVTFFGIVLVIYYLLYGKKRDYF